MMRGNRSFFSRAPLTMASMILGWSEPRFTKQWLTPAAQRASKKANEVVYMLGSIVDRLRRGEGVAGLPNWVLVGKLRGFPNVGCLWSG